MLNLSSHFSVFFVFSFYVNGLDMDFSLYRLLFVNLSYYKLFAPFNTGVYKGIGYSSSTEAIR